RQRRVLRKRGTEHGLGTGNVSTQLQEHGQIVLQDGAGRERSSAGARRAQRSGFIVESRVGESGRPVPDRRSGTATKQLERPGQPTLGDLVLSPLERYDGPAQHDLAILPGAAGGIAKYGVGL